MNARKFLTSLIILTAFIFCAYSEGRPNNLVRFGKIGGGYVPRDGFVPDENTANLIALAILTNIYGSKKINDELPFQVTLKNGVWIVEGAPLPENKAGGVVIIKLLKSDGRVLYVSHGK